MLLIYATYIYTLFFQCSLSFRSKFTGLASSASNCNGTARNVNAFGIFLLAWLLAAGAFQSPLPPHVANLEKEAKKKKKRKTSADWSLFGHVLHSGFFFGFSFVKGTAKKSPKKSIYWMSLGD